MYLQFNGDGVLEMYTNDKDNVLTEVVKSNAGIDGEEVKSIIYELNEGIIEVVDEDLLAHLPHLKLVANEVVIDQEAEGVVAERKATAERIEVIRCLLSELDYDINACEDGVIKTKTLAEYRAERIALRNELRVLLGKQAAEVTEEL